MSVMQITEKVQNFESIHSIRSIWRTSSDCLHPSVILCHPFKAKLLLNSKQIIWIWISKTGDKHARKCSKYINRTKKNNNWRSTCRLLCVFNYLSHGPWSISNDFCHNELHICGFEVFISLHEELLISLMFWYITKYLEQNKSHQPQL